MKAYLGYNKLKPKTMCLKKYLPKNKSQSDYRYIHYQDPSFQSKFKGVVLKKDYHIYSLFCKRLREKSSHSPNKAFSQCNSPKKDLQLSVSAPRYFDYFKLNGDNSIYSKINNNELCMKINSNLLRKKYSSNEEEKNSNMNKYKLNFSLPIIPRTMLVGKEACIKNEYLISKLAFFSK